MLELLFAQSMPHFDGTYWINLTSRVLHILSAIVLVGGVFYVRMIVAPRVAISGNSADAESWFAGNRAAWAKWIGIATALLIVTGLYNFITIIKTNEIAKSYHMLGTLKILLSLVVFFLAAVLAGRTALAQRLRENMKFWLSICLLSAVVVVIMGSVMRSYPREPKPTVGPALVAPDN